MDDAVKKRKEEFVSGHGGTTMLEVSLVSSVCPLLMLLSRCVFDRLLSRADGHPFLPLLVRGVRRGSPWLRFALDFAIVVPGTLASVLFPALGMFLALAALAASWYLLGQTAARNARAGAKVPALFPGSTPAVPVASGQSPREFQHHLHQGRSSPRGKPGSPSQGLDHAYSASGGGGGDTQYRFPFLSQYRTGMMIATALAILAVDFPAFPRRLAKTEDGGVSLMDVGAGSFLFSNAVAQGIHMHKTGGQPRSLAAVAPLAVAAVARCVSIALLNYQEHVTEYGVHWNFFATLVVVTILALAAGVPARRGVLVGCFILVLHQGLLNHAGLAAYVRTHPRSNFVHANKEGVVSTLGYYGLFLVGTGVGDSLAKRRGRRAWVRAVGLVSMGSLLAYATVFAAWDYEPPSRRITNAPYLIFTIAYNLQQLASFMAADLVVGPGPQPLATAVNRNQLLVFIVANLATGAVNLSMDTLAAGTPLAITVLLVYLGAVLGLAFALEVGGITLKFW